MVAGTPASAIRQGLEEAEIKTELGIKNSQGRPQRRTRPLRTVDIHYMNIPYAPYLDLFRKEMVKSLMPRDDVNAKRIAEYIHKILTALWIKETKLREIEENTLRKYAELVPQISEAIKNEEGGSILAAEMTRNLLVFPDHEAAQATLQKVARLLFQLNSEQSSGLMRSMATIEAEAHTTHITALRDAYIPPDTTVERPQSLTPQETLSLQSYLREKFSSDSSVLVVNSTMVIGGGSKRTYIVELHNTRSLPKYIVIRADFSASVQGRNDLVTEYAVLQEVYESGLPTPKPFMLETDCSVLGSPFVIVSRMRGHNIGDWNMAWEPSEEFAIDLAHTLARLHNLPLTRVGRIIPGADISITEKISKNLDRFETAWRYQGSSSIAMEQAFLWLRDHIEFSEGQRSILHSDVGCHNTLGEDGRLTALLDWENTEIGNPAQELTYAEPHIRRMLDWDRFLAEYSGAGGHIPSQQNIDFYRLYSSVFSMHFLFISRSFLLSGISSSMVHAYATQNMFYEFEHALKENVKAVYTRY